MSDVSPSVMLVAFAWIYYFIKGCKLQHNANGTGTSIKRNFSATTMITPRYERAGLILSPYLPICK